MIGALIGDLAAWSWENDKDLFYSRLIGNDSEISVYGHALLRSGSKNVIYDREAPTSPIGEPKDISYPGQWLMWHIVAAWTDDIVPKDMPTFHSIDKAEGYAKYFMESLIKELRKGSTKSQAFESNHVFQSLMKKDFGGWKGDSVPEGDCILVYVFRAWDSFYRGFDFTSSIHNAMRWPGDKHLLGALTGAFAEAMYGCQYNFIKKKYAKENEIRTEFNILGVGEKYNYHHGLILEMTRLSQQWKAFYGKNEALTNVERHHWTNIYNIFSTVSFSEEDYTKIMRAKATTWDNRYGIYLDDGWFYVYRSLCVIGRFKLQRNDDSNYRFCSLQRSEGVDLNHFALALELAIYETCGVLNIPMRQICTYAKACKYFNGENEVPVQWDGKAEGKFWNGEKQFITTVSNYEVWTKMAEDCEVNLTNVLRTKFMSYCPEQRAMLCYIETLYRKWCPMDDFNWIMQY